MRIGGIHDGEVTPAALHQRRLDNITGGGFGDVTQFASAIKYRASGAIKHLAYGNGLNLDLTYDARQRITQQKLAPTGTPTQGQVNRVHDYQYYDDGRIKFIADNFDHNFDRSYSYDQIGRLKGAFTGHEARGEQFGPTSPYKETFQYNEWDNTTDRFTRTWSYQTGMQGFRSNGQWVSTGPVAYQNNRKAGVSYDADGRVTSDGLTHVYDATGRQTSSQDSRNNVTQGYDGDGRRVKRVEAVSTTSGSPPVTTTTTTTVYEVRSSVLGGVVVELDAQGVRKVDYVYAGAGIILAKGAPSGVPSSAIFVNHQAVTGSEQLSAMGGVNSGRTELDPLGADVGTFEPLVDDPGRDFPLIFGAMRRADTGCLMDGLAIPCTVAAEITDFNARTGSGMTQVGASYRFADRLLGRVDDTSGRERGVGAVPGTQHVWIADWRDYFIAPNTNNPGDGGTSGTIDFGHFETMPNGSSLSTVVSPQNSQKPIPLTPDEIKNLRGRANNLLTEKCKSFLKELYATLGKRNRNNPQVASDIDSAFNLLLDSKQKGFVWIKGAYSYAAGSVGTNSARVELGRGVGYFQLPVTTIHELIHHSAKSGYSAPSGGRSGAS